MMRFHTMAKNRPEMKMLNNSIAGRQAPDQKYDTFEQVDVIVNREVARYPENVLGKEIFEPESLRKNSERGLPKPGEQKRKASVFAQRKSQVGISSFVGG